MHRRTLLGILCSTITAGCGGLGNTTPDDLEITLDPRTSFEPPRIKEHQLVPYEVEDVPTRTDSTVETEDQSGTIEFTVTNRSGSPLSIAPDNWGLWRDTGEGWRDVRNGAYKLLTRTVEPSETFEWEINIEKSSEQPPYSDSETPKRSLAPSDGSDYRIEAVPLSTGRYLFANRGAELEGTRYAFAVLFDVE